MVLVLAEFQAANKPGKATLTVRQLGLISLLLFILSLSLSLSTIGFFKLLYWRLLRNYKVLMIYKWPDPLFH